MNKNISILLISFVLCSFSIFTMDAMKHSGGSVDEKEEACARLMSLQGRIRLATKPEETSQEEFNAFKEDLKQGLTTGKISPKDFTMGNVLILSHIKATGSFEEWISFSIRGCDQPSAASLSTFTADERAAKIAEYKARYKDEKERLLEVQAILGFKPMPTENPEPVYASGKIPFRLITASLLVFVGIGLWFFSTTARRVKLRHKRFLVVSNIS